MPESDASPPVAAQNTPEWGKGLYTLGLAALGASEVYFMFQAEVRDPLHLPIGLLVLFLAVLPGLLWAKRGRASLPVFEVLMLTTANAYALPLLNGHQDLVFYVPEDISTAGFAVLLFQGIAILAYEVTQGRPSPHPFWRDEIISGGLGRLLGYGMALNTAYVLVSSFTQLIPPESASILRAVFFGIGIVATFITSRRLGAGELTPGERVFFVVNLLVQCLLMMTSLLLVASVSLLLLALLGYVSSSGRLPLAACAVSLFTLAILHHGKPEMRAKYWGEERLRPALTEVPAFFTEWFTRGLEFSDDEEDRVTSKLIDRTSLFHILCLVVSVTPSQQPFLEGETYQDIPGQFVPRVLWPEKPPGHVSTSRLSVYYGLQTEEDTEKTTIGFGMVTEAFANFGFIGVAALGALLGFTIKKVQRWGLDSPLFSYGGLILVLLLAWSFQTEFTLSLWLASLYQACLAVLVVPFLLRRVFG